MEVRENEKRHEENLQILWSIYNREHGSHCKTREWQNWTNDFMKLSTTFIYGLIAIAALAIIFWIVSDTEWDCSELRIFLRKKASDITIGELIVVSALIAPWFQINRIRK
jgi:hypothetical protein